jgi:uncharacterized protein YdhG (YjbR/CyaY superfamily)
MKKKFKNRRILKKTTRKGAARKSAAGVKKKSAAPKKRGEKFDTVAGYLVSTPEPARSALNQIRAAIREVVPPGSTEVISYNIPAFKHTRILVWYAAFAHHCSVFPGKAVVEQFKDELKGYTIAKGTVQFPLDRPMPLELIKKIAQARVESE